MSSFLRWLPAVSLASFLYYLSSMPGLRVVPKRWLPLWLDKLLASYTLKIGTSGFFSYTLSLQPEFVVRKLGHFGAFALLGATVYFAVRSKRTAIILAILFAVLDEVHQGMTPGRDCRFWDIVLDSAAVICGVAAYQRFSIGTPRKGRNEPD